MLPTFNPSSGLPIMARPPRAASPAFAPAPLSIFEPRTMAAEMVDADTMRRRLDLCAGCPFRQISQSGDWCAADDPHGGRKLTRLAARRERLPLWGCKHPARAACRGWFSEKRPPLCPSSPPAGGWPDDSKPACFAAGGGAGVGGGKGASEKTNMVGTIGRMPSFTFPALGELLAAILPAIPPVGAFIAPVATGAVETVAALIRRPALVALGDSRPVLDALRDPAAACDLDPYDAADDAAEENP